MKLNLGCGPHALQGWSNYDIEAHPGVAYCDLSKPLPFPSGVAKYVYSEHFIEHLTKEQIKVFLSECCRVLEPGGTLRISTPDLSTLVQDYLDRKINRWSPTWVPESPCEMVNHGLSLWGHKYVMDFSEIFQLLKQAGFYMVGTAQWRESYIADLRDLEVRPDCKDLIIEATKP